LKTYRPSFVFAWMALAMSFASVARAQSLPEQMRACRAETDDSRRLGCYDRAAATLDKTTASAAPAAPSAASAAPVASTVSAPAAPATKAVTSTPASSGTAEFGVSEGPLAAKRQAKGLKEITAVVTAVSFRVRGELMMTLDNGQVWAQNEAIEYFPVNVGDTVKIRSAALGSYTLATPAKRTTKVTRVR
jgi:hypothetical protein